VAFPGVPKQLDPALYTVIEEQQLGFALFDALVWVDAKLEPQPLLAETWEATADLRQWTFKLREGVKFHHGTPLTAEDVVYTFTRILNPKLGSPFRSSLGFVETVVAVDPYTVRFQLRTPSAELPLLLGAPLARIVAHDYRASLLAAKPSGTGPFQFAEYTAGVGARVVRNTEYWQPDQPLLEAIEYRFLPYTRQLDALRNAEIDVIAQLGSEDLATLASDPAITTVEVTSGAYQNIVMRATERPFTDRRVRQALKLCVDRQQLLQQVLLGKGTVGSDHPVAPISPFVAELATPRYDPDQARQLLSQAGYPRGLTLDLLTSTVRPGMVELALALQQMAKPAGIEIQVVRAPAQVYWSDYAGKVPFHTGNWGFRPSIDETFMAAYHSHSKGNESNWRNPALDEWIDKARGERAAARRKELYHQAQKLLMEEGAVIIPYFKPTLMALRRNVRNFTPHPAGWLDLRQVDVG
jgi:peptide/nickel transport system substrate-binding protein